MRTAHIITRLILGGAQENTLLNCEDLAQIYGDEVLLITGPALGPEGSLLDRAGQGRGGLKVEVVDSLRRAIHPWRDANAYRELKRVLRAYRPDVVHTHSAKAGILGRAAAHALGVPAIVHGVHGAPFHDYQSRLAWRFSRDCERWAAKRCHAMISVADAMTDLLVNAGVAPREKFTTIYSGMEVEPFLAAPAERDRVRQELGYAPSDVVIGKIARLFHLKGHEFVIQAAKRIVAAQPNAKFLFVGDGILQSHLKEQIRALGLEKHFQFTGLVPPEKIPELIAAMDIVVHTSLREGLARVLPQALIVGRPVVSFDIDGAREVAIPGETGYLIPPNVDALTNAVIELAANPALRANLGAEGRHRFTHQFRHEHMTAETRKLYDRLLARSN
jgi:glycosyltransferase involved in cell wall biosynthesis